MISSTSPAILVAVDGLGKGECLRISQPVMNTRAALKEKYDIVSNVADVVNYDPLLAANILILVATMNSLTDGIWPTTPGGLSPTQIIIPYKGLDKTPVRFGGILGQIRSHIDYAIETRSSLNFLGSSTYDDFGSNVTSTSSMATQGLANTVGSLSSTSSAIRYAGPCFELDDIENFGTPVGLVKKITRVKLANFTGLNDALKRANVDLDNLEDPVYADTIRQVLTTITNREALTTVADQFGVPVSGSGAAQLTFTNSGQPLTSLLDFTDLSKLAKASDISGLKVTLPQLATKLSDLGGTFESVDQAAGLFANIYTPASGKLDQYASSLSSFFSNVSANIADVTGVGDHPLGIPVVTNFTEVVSSGRNILTIQTVDQVSNSSVLALNDVFVYSGELFLKAGIDLANQPTVFGLTHLKSFATSIFDIGAESETTGSGSKKVLVNMTDTDTHYGSSITSLLAEGKNKAVMIDSGIQPPRFIDN